MLCGQDTIHGLERELSLSVQKIGKMCLSKPSLATEQRNAHRPPLYSAQQLEAKAFVHLCKVHLWKICHQQ
jgi:hypothetical protein